MFREIFVILFVPFTIGFLLDTNNPQKPSETYMTVSDFFDAKTIFQNRMDQNHKETSDLRHDVDTKLALLTSQMQEMFVSLQNKTKHDNVQNASNGTQEMERKFQELWVNYSHLQNKLDEIQMNFTKEMAQCKNKIMGHEKELTDLRTLKNIQPLRDATIVKNQLQSVNTELHALSVSDHARREDFRALYNLTVNGQKYTQEQLREQNVSISQRFHHFGNRENASLDMLNRKIEVLIEKKHNMTQEKQRSQDRMLEDLKRNVNLTFTNLQLQISNNGDKVAMTACVRYRQLSYSAGNVLKFDDIRTHVGILNDNLSTFVSSGKFTCQKEGLYLISSWILSDTDIATIGIYRNSNNLAKVYITYDSDSDTSAGTGTAVVSVELQVGDTVYVKAENNMRVFNDMRCCLTIAKLK